MIFRIYPTKDTFVSNVLLRSTPQTGSNYGHAESLELYKIAGISGTTGINSGSQYSRLLLQFNTGALDTFVGIGYVPTRAKFFYMRLTHETTSEALPSSFDVEVFPVSGAWDEGRGMDTSDHTDKGVANWWKRTSTEYWTSRGGDFQASPRLTTHFDLGNENLDVDVTAVFQSWASGTFPNDGLLVRMTSSVEVDSNYTNHYLKSFYSRHSQWPDRRPYVEVRWNDFMGDDRGRMHWNRTGSVYLHNVVDGQYQNLSIGSNALIVKLADASGTLMSLTASATGLTGIYSASFALPTGSYSGSLFYDRWGSGSFSFMTGTISFSTDSPVTATPSREYIGRVVNLRDFYEPDETVRFDTYFRRKGYKPTVVLTSSANLRPDIMERAFYAIENDSTRERVVPFGTGSLQHTRLSYDYQGNYFVFPMSNLHSGEVYRVIFMVEKDGQKQVLDNDIKFRVR